MFTVGGRGGGGWGVEIPPLSSCEDPISRTSIFRSSNGDSKSFSAGYEFNKGGGQKCWCHTKNLLPVPSQPLKITSAAGKNYIRGCDPPQERKGPTPLWKFWWPVDSWYRNVRLEDFRWYVKPVFTRLNSRWCYYVGQEKFNALQMNGRCFSFFSEHNFPSSGITETLCRS